MVFLTLGCIFCELGGDLSLEEMYNLKNPVLSEYIKMCVAHCYFKIFYFSVSFHIYKISIYTKNRHLK